MFGNHQIACHQNYTINFSKVATRISPRYEKLVSNYSDTAYTNEKSLCPAGFDFDCSGIKAGAVISKQRSYPIYIIKVHEIFLRRLNACLKGRAVFEFYFRTILKDIYFSDSVHGVQFTRKCEFESRSSQRIFVGLVI